MGNRKYKIAGSYGSYLEGTLNEYAQIGWRFVSFVDKEESENGPDYYMFLLEMDELTEVE